jgi:outer membrane receptor protein involved in Fe transport
MIVGLSQHNDLFVSGGYGFHSNDARGVTKSLDPANALVRVKGAEVGIKNRSISNLQTALSVWMMDSQSELVFAGDAGNTEPTGAARRVGIEWANYYKPTPWLIVDADLSLSRARYTGADAAGNRYVPEAMEQTLSIGTAIVDYNSWFGGARLRYFGSRALLEDNSQRSQPSTLVNVKVGKTLDKNFDLVCDVYNLFDRKTYDIQYYYESKMATEPSSVNDHMVHPGEPRSVRLTLRYKY